jgi:tetratricopeptide (TPR) repeat protein
VKEEMGDLLLQHLGEIDQAAKYYDECYDIRVDLTKTGHADPVFRADVAWAINKQGDVEQERSERDKGEQRKAGRQKAAERFKEARKSFQELNEHLFDSLVWPHQLALIDNNIGLIDVKNGDFGEAIGEFDSAARMLKLVVERDPKNLYRLSALAWTYDNQGNATLKLADAGEGDHTTQLKNAKQTFEKALELRGKIHDDARAKKLWEYDLNESEANVAATQAFIDLALGNHREAAAGFDQATHFLNLAADVFAKETNKPVNADLVARDIEYLHRAGAEYAKFGDAEDARRDLAQAAQLLHDNQSKLDAADLQKLTRLLADDANLTSGN